VSSRHFFETNKINNRTDHLLLKPDILTCYQHLPRVAPIPKCCAVDRKALEQLANSRTEQARIVGRARIILGCVEGRPVTERATELCECAQKPSFSRVSGSKRRG